MSTGATLSVIKRPSVIVMPSRMPLAHKQWYISHLVLSIFCCQLSNASLTTISSGTNTSPLFDLSMQQWAMLVVPCPILDVKTMGKHPLGYKCVWFHGNKGAGNFAFAIIGGVKQINKTVIEKSYISYWRQSICWSFLLFSRIGGQVDPETYETEENILW